jgi:hypothetical protein
MPQLLSLRPLRPPERRSTGHITRLCALMRARQLGGQNQVPVARRDRGPQPGLQLLFGRDLAHLGILREQGWLRPPADPARRACAPAKRLIRKMGGSRSAPLLTLLYALTFARCSRQPVPAARRFRRASFDRGRSRLLSRGYRWFESISLQRGVMCEPDSALPRTCLSAGRRVAGARASGHRFRRARSAR